MAEFIDKRLILAFPIRENHCDKENANPYFINGIETVMEYIENLPTADIVPEKHGRWEVIRVPNHWDKARCSVCKRIFESYEWGTRYCSCCGAKMKESVKHDE